MKYKIVERDAFQAIGIKRKVLCNAEGGSPGPGIAEFWSEAFENGTVKQLLELNSGEINGLLGITKNFDKERNAIEYWIVTEYLDNVNALAEFSSIEIPASKWVVFEVVGPASTAMPSAWKHIFSDWFPSNGYELSEIAPPFEAYIDPNPYKENSLNEIWVGIK
ncbi:GyrI-like domain-containing protein [Halalkalibacter okhensis]|uniref:Transcriptional regulator n=1 Tax=Halalkalibacter okhensis TaxID=333138 RepID=A0A0B0ING4_9BACI|nr:GyrI-like domain-containing protein [Halalkalibacter okhensis]KHF41624.1 transcriptional regulator [Halalkalibacter okhensis]